MTLKTIKIICSIECLFTLVLAFILIAMPHLGAKLFLTTVVAQNSLPFVQFYGEMLLVWNLYFYHALNGKIEHLFRFLKTTMMGDLIVIYIHTYTIIYCGAAAIGNIVFVITTIIGFLFRAYVTWKKDKFIYD